MEKQEKRWLTPEDLEREYNFSKSWQAKARMMSNKIRLPYVKIGAKFIRYDRQEIDRWIEKHKIYEVKDED